MRVEWEFNLGLEVRGLGLSPGPAMSLLFHGMSPSPVPAGPEDSYKVRTVLAVASSLSSSLSTAGPITILRASLDWA